MREKSLSEMIAGNLRKALFGVLAVTIAINALLVVYDVRSLTENIYDTFSKQLQNVARVSSQRGDMLSLQKDLESVAFPLAETFSVEVKITDALTQKMLVDIPGSSDGVTKFFRKTVRSELEMNPVGSLDAVITFDITRIVIVAILRALLSSILIVSAIFLIQRYIQQLNSQNLDPIDRFSRWLDSLGPEALANQDVRVPTEGLHSELKLGLEAIASKMYTLSQQNAQLLVEKQVGVVARQVAHDIRSPLSALNMLLANVSGISSSQKDIISQVSQRISAIANDLLTSAKMSEGKTNRSKGIYFDFHRNLLEIFHEKSAEYRSSTRIALVFQIRSDIADTKIYFDANDFKRIISNLINNSYEAIDGEGRITVEAWRTANHAHLRIADSGKGIPDEILKKLTREPVSSKIDGNGIGILSAKMALEQAGHSLTIQSEVNEGSQVFIDFNLTVQAKIG